MSRPAAFWNQTQFSVSETGPRWLGRRCMRLALGGLLVAAGILLSPTHLLRGQTQQPTSPVPLVSLAEVSANPGDDLMMPLIFTADRQNPLRSFTVKIEYVSNSLSFQNISLGMAAEMVEADAQHQLSEVEADERGLKRATLQVSMSLPDSTAAQELPDGLLAYLRFKVSEEARPVKIRMRPTVVAAEDLSTPPQEVAQVSVEEGLVVVSEGLTPIIGCFFYMH